MCGGLRFGKFIITDVGAWSEITILWYSLVLTQCSSLLSTRKKINPRVCPVNVGEERKGFGRWIKISPWVT